MIDERIKAVYLWQNGQVMVFDLHGEQMPAYQDPAARDRLRRAFPERWWQRGVWREYVVTPDLEILRFQDALRDALPEDLAAWPWARAADDD